MCAMCSLKSKACYPNARSGADRPCECAEGAQLGRDGDTPAVRASCWRSGAPELERLGALPSV
eukprot:2615903-Pleurochrysis_carterae.AAC.2